ncbi:MAG: OmpA family protein [Bacteroidales bacterium]|nr:OmpA family protein [Bacteroidales bacterium]
MKAKLIFILMLFAAISLQAQIKVDVKEKVKNQTNRRANQRTDEAIDKSLDKLEKGIGNLFKKKKKESKQENEISPVEASDSGNENQAASSNAEESKAPNVVWSKFDFVPGDYVIFEDGPSIDEENGEFPSRWDLNGGVVEIANMEDEAVIYILESNHRGGIVPYLENSDEDYLPEVFTIEFDAFFTAKTYCGRYFINFYDLKNQRRNDNLSLVVYPNSLSLGDSEMKYPGKSKGNWDEEGGWRHISIAYTKGKMKAYLDDTRLINIPHYEGNPSGFTISAETSNTNKYQKFIKNIRIAKGGVKYYDRVLQDGKIIVNGIRFDLNKATIKPESYGAINKIYDLMKKQPELNFSVEGHTDSDGADDYNMTLSKARGEAVMNHLIKMGISSERLLSNGWGESKPIDNNTTAEGKANNRRVEFVTF